MNMTPSPLGNVITIDDEQIKSHLDRVVRGSAEETLNSSNERPLIADACPTQCWQWSNLTAATLVDSLPIKKVGRIMHDHPQTALASTAQTRTDRGHRLIYGHVVSELGHAPASTDDDGR